MPTGAVLGAAFGVGGALVVGLTMLIYRYHVAQKKGCDTWANRGSWASVIPPVSEPSTRAGSVRTAYKSTGHLAAAESSSPTPATNYNGSRRTSRKPSVNHLYLPLSQKNFLTDSVQPPATAVASTAVDMSSSSGGLGGSGGSRSPRSSPLSYFSLDLPANLFGSSPQNQSCGSSSSPLLPLVSRLARTPSTNSKQNNGNNQSSPGHPRGRSESLSFAQQRSPSSCRHLMTSTPTPNSAAAAAAAGAGSSGSSNNINVSGGHLNPTPYPSPMLSPNPMLSPAPSFSSLLNCLSPSATPCSSPIPIQPIQAPQQQPQQQPAPPPSPLIRNRSRSPMLSKMSSIHSSTSTNSNQSQGSTTSLFGPTPTPLGSSRMKGALQPELYRRETTIHVGLDDDSAGNDVTQNATGDDCTARPDPSAAGKNGRTGSAVPLARLHFRLSYDFDKSDMLVHLIEARDLSLGSEGNVGSINGTVGSSSSSGGSVSSATSVSSSTQQQPPVREAHIRLNLQPEVDQRRRQSANRIRLVQDAHCVFDERFKFPVSHDQLAEKTLQFQVCEYDRFSRPCVIGELLFSLAERDVGSSTTPVDIWAEMMRNTTPDESRPQLLISLSYLPSAERLTVVVLKAKNLVVPANKENIDPLVKLYLMVNGKRLKKKKTEYRRGTSQPVWNQALAFTIPSPKLHSCTLEIVVVDHGSEKGKNAQLGCISLGPEQPPSTPQRQHWQDMAHNVRKSIAMWHYLQ